jgi:hypothetical protein
VLFLAMIVKWTKHIDVLIESIWPIHVPSANSLPKPVILSATSFINIIKSNGPKTDLGAHQPLMTKHIDVLIERTSKQFNILRKLKYRLKRERAMGPRPTLGHTSL